MENWILLPALILGAIAIAVSIYHRGEILRRQTEWEVRWMKRSQLAQSDLGKLRGEVQELKARLEDRDREQQERYLGGERGGGDRGPNGINLNQRTQVLRLLRRGEPAARVATVLGIAQCEVELISKVQKITREARLPQTTAGKETDGSG